jgi:phosphate transport system substrate-binding protein
MVFQVGKTSKARNSLVSVAFIFVLSACSTSTQTGAVSQSPLSPLSQTSATSIKLDGSSTVYPISDAVVKAFKQANPTVAIESSFSGTTGGFRKFCAGETQISNASRPISTEEIAACRQAGIRFVELPIAFDALTVAINPQNDWATDLTVDELRKIWEPGAQGKIKNWQQVRSSFPNRPLNLYGAGKDSGTYDYFAEVITDGSNTRSDYTSSEDDNVLVEGVRIDPNALGYFGFSYFEQSQDKLKAVAIDDGKGKGAVAPSRTAVESAEYQPLSRPLFLYVNLEASQKNEDLRNFIEFYLKNAQATVASVGAAPLPQEAYDINKVHLYNGEVGTAYEGKPQPYLTIREVLQKEKAL